MRAHEIDYDGHDRSAFRPEFINRVDEIVVFHPLDQEQIRQIGAMQIEGLKKRLTERDLRLDISGELTFS